MNETPETVQRFCSQCNNAVDADARFCKYCGFDFAGSTANSEANAIAENNPPATESKLHGNNSTLYVFGGIVALAVLVIIGLVVLKSSNRNSQESVIENSNTNSVSAAANTLSVKAQQIEEKILRGEALNASDLEGLSTSELRILRNVHFARYGRKYTQPELSNYFQSRSWYKPSDDYKNSMVNSTDKANINLILSLEKPTETTASDNTNVSSTPVISEPAPASNPKELSRESILTLLRSKNYSIPVEATMSTDSNTLGKGDITSLYMQMVKQKIITCRNEEGYLKFCSPSANGNNLYISTQETSMVEGGISLVVGQKLPSAVTGISRIDQNTAYADVTFSFEANNSYNFYSKWSQAFKRTPNTQSEQHRAILRLYDDGWRSEQVLNR